MQEKPKVSHFANNKDSREKTHDKSAIEIKRATLGEFYPLPRTYDQKKSAELLRQRMYTRRLAKYPSFYIAAYGSIVVGLTLIYFKNLAEVWLGSGGGGGTISTVFFSFLIAMIIFFLVYAWIRYVINTFYALGRSTRLFWIANGILLTVLIALEQNQTIFLSNIVSTIVFIVFYFVSTLGISSIIIRDFRK